MIKLCLVPDQKRLELATHIQNLTTSQKEDTKLSKEERRYKQVKRWTENIDLLTKDMVIDVFTYKFYPRIGDLEYGGILI